MIDSTAEKQVNQHNHKDNQQDLDQPRQNNIIKIVVNNQKKRGTPSPKDPSLYRENLIKLTEKLAEAAKSGRLRGLGMIAEFEDGYTFDLEGAYLLDPGCAALPLMRLQDHVLSQIKNQEQEDSDV